MASRLCPLCNVETDDTTCPTDGTTTIWRSLTPARGLPQPGQVVGGRYRIVEPIGSGGYGAVYRVTHTGTGQACALKVMNIAMDAGDGALRRFFAEARVTAGLRHANTLRVFDFGQDDAGWFFIAMELLVGRTLGEWLRLRRRSKRALRESEAVYVGVSVLRSLVEAHEAGLVHRDLKPQNIFLHEVSGDEPLVKVLDFGIAKSAEFALTLDQQALGTPLYMSPEQCMAQPLDGRSDLYSLGCILFEAIAGRPPFAADNLAGVVMQQVAAAPPDLRQRAQGPVSADYVAIVAKALAKSPADRFASAAEMRDALRACAPPAADDWAPPTVGATPGADGQADAAVHAPTADQAAVPAIEPVALAAAAGVALASTQARPRGPSTAIAGGLELPEGAPGGDAADTRLEAQQLTADYGAAAPIGGTLAIGAAAEALQATLVQAAPPPEGAGAASGAATPQAPTLEIPPLDAPAARVAVAAPRPLALDAAVADGPRRVGIWVGVAVVALVAIGVSIGLRSAPPAAETATAPAAPPVAVPGAALGTAPGAAPPAAPPAASNVEAAAPAAAHAAAAAPALPGALTPTAAPAAPAATAAPPPPPTRASEAPPVTGQPVAGRPPRAKPRARKVERVAPAAEEDRL